MKKEIEDKVKEIEGVHELSGMRSHQFGNKYHVEVRIKVNQNKLTKDSCAIAQKVKESVSELEEVADVFVLIEPEDLDNK